jgi:hypothetical protein
MAPLEVERFSIRVSTGSLLPCWAELALYRPMGISRIVLPDLDHSRQGHLPYDTCMRGRCTLLGNGRESYAKTGQALHCIGGGVKGATQIPRTWYPSPMITLDTMRWSLEYRLDIRGDRDLHLRAPLAPRARA